MKIKTLFSAALLHTAFLFPTSANWITAGNGIWSNAANWTAGGPPNTAGDIATFPNVGIGNVTVTVDAPFTVGTLNFTGGTAYLISGTNSLNLIGSAGTAAINASQGTNISVPMILTNPLTVTNNSFANVPLSGIMSGPGSLTLVGVSNTSFITLSGANTYSGGTTLQAGTPLNLQGVATIPATGTFTIGGTAKCLVANALNPAGAVNIINGGTLDLNNLSQVMGSLSGVAGGTITLSQTLTSNTSIATTYSGTMTGAGGFTLTGSGGVLTLGTSPGYTGTTTVSGSTLFLNPGVTLPSGGNLTVNGPGVLNLNNNNQTVGVLSGTGAGSVILGSGTLFASALVSSTFAGVISGTGSFIKGGISTLTFTGNNTYTGGTTVIGGVLQLGANNALAPTGPVTITGAVLDMTPAASTQQAIGPLISANAASTIHLGATQLTINETSNTSFTGTIDGTGSIVMAGPGVLTMNTAGTTTYSGGTFITGGVLQLGASGALPSGGNLTVNSPGTFDMNTFSQTVGLLSGNGSITTGGGALTVLIPSGMSSTFSGVISQSGSLVVGDVNPRGILILTGPNTYSGGTTVFAGATLQGNSTSLQGSILNNGNLVFNQTFPGAYSGALSGTGTLFLIGGSSLTLAGLTPTQGNTIVNSGALIIGSGVTLTSPVTVNPGGFLGPVATGGTGTIIGNVNVSGTTVLGLGTLNTTGTFTQAPGSTFDVEVSSSSSGLLANTGTVTLSGSPTVDVSFLPGAFAPFKTYTIVTSTTPVAGTFGSVIIENPFFEGSLIYNALPPGSVQLVLQIAPFSKVIKGGNAGEIAKCINVTAFPQETDILSIIDTLVFLPVKEVRDALDKMQPSQLKALAITEENNLLIRRTTVSQHVEDFYKTDCNQDITQCHHWNIWGNFSGDFLRQEGQTENVGYRADSYGVTTGIDARVSRKAVLGVAVGCDHSKLHWSDSRGHGSIKSGYVGPYLALFARHGFINLSLLGSINKYRASRHISFPGVDAHAESQHIGQGMIAHLDFGYLLNPTAGMTFSPILGVDYIRLWEKSYTEHGAPGLNMKILETREFLARSELGFEIAKCAILSHNKWTHDLKLLWIHQFPIKGQHLNAQFANVNCTYTVKGLEPNQDYLDIGTGLTGFFFHDKLSIALRYEGKFGDGIRDNTGYVQITCRF